jgi:hypothetical protein
VAEPAPYDVNNLTDAQILALDKNLNAPAPLSAPPAAEAQPSTFDVSKLTDQQVLDLAKKLEQQPSSSKYAPSKDQVAAFAGRYLEATPFFGKQLLEGVQKLGARADSGPGSDELPPPGSGAQHVGMDLPGGATSYADALQARKAMLEKATTEHPVAGGLGAVAGGTAGMAPLMAAFPTAFGAGEGTTAFRGLMATLYGGGIGGADAAVKSNFDPTKTAIGAGISAAGGLAAMPVAAGAGSAAARAVDNIFGLSKAGGPLGPISRAGVRYIADTIGNPAKARQFIAEMNALGPQATLADVSPEFTMVARAAAGRPGMRDAIFAPLIARNDTKNARLAADLNAAGGRPIDPARVDAALQAQQGALSPDYEYVINHARAVDTEPLANRLDALTSVLKGPELTAVQRVRSMLDVNGAPGNLDPHPRALLNTRHAIDGMLTGETNPSVIRQLTAARRLVDAELTRAAPAIKDIDAYHQELARQREALGLGAKLFDTGKTAQRPQSFAEDFRASAIAPERSTFTGPSAAPLRQQQGTRAEMDRLVGTKANDPLALQAAFKSEGDWPRMKLEATFGPERAKLILDAVDRETQFARTANRVASGSDTDASKRFGDFLDKLAKPVSLPLNVTWEGLIGAGLVSGARKLLGADAEAKAQRFAAELGHLAVAQGPDRDRYMRSLLDLVNNRQSLEPIANKAATAMRTLIIGAASGRPVQPDFMRN